MSILKNLKNGIVNYFYGGTEEEKNGEETTNSNQTQKTEEEKLDDRLFAKYKKEAKQQADKVKDPDYREIFIKKIDLATTKQKLTEIRAEMQQYSKYEERKDRESDQLFAEFEEVKRMADEVDDPKLRKFFLEEIDQATTRQELTQVVRKMQKRIEYQERPLEYEENAQLFVRHRKKVKQQADKVDDPEFREIFMEEIDQATTEQELDEVEIAVREHLEYQN